MPKDLIGWLPFIIVICLALILLKIPSKQDIHDAASAGVRDAIQDSGIIDRLQDFKDADNPDLWELRAAESEEKHRKATEKK